MMPAPDYSSDSVVLGNSSDALEDYKGFRLFLTLAAAFKDVDERAIKRKGKNTINRIIGPPFSQ